MFVFLVPHKGLFTKGGTYSVAFEAVGLGSGFGVREGATTPVQRALIPAWHWMQML